MKTNKLLLIALAAALSAGSTYAQDKILTPGDNSVAVGGSLTISSDYPANEGPWNIGDSNPSTKYLNHGVLYTGVITTPIYGPTVIKSMLLTTANDFEARDPSSYELYGTNDAITSGDNSDGLAENWTLISKGSLSLPSDRLTNAPLVTFGENETSYTSYKLIFPTVKDSSNGSMQIADVQFYEKVDPIIDPEDPGYGEDWGILDANDDVKAVQTPSKTDIDYATGDWEVAGAGSPAYCSYDNNKTTRFAPTFNGAPVGLAVQPTAGISKVEYFQLMTFTNKNSFDPTGYQLFGTMDTLASADKSLGTNENWTLIKEGKITMPTTPSSWSDKIYVNAGEFYNCYKLLFTGIRATGSEDVDRVQVAELQMYGDVIGSGLENILRPGDKAMAVHPTKEFFYLTNNSGYPSNENPPNVIDGDVSTKYLNNQASGAGFIVTPNAGAKAVKSFKLWTANDAEDRDPATYEIYGTNEAIVSADNSYGTDENWTLIESGSISLPSARLTEGDLYAVNNTTAYKSYKVVFPTCKGTALFQLADIQFYTDAAGTAGIFAAGDPIIAIGAPQQGSHMGNVKEQMQHTIDQDTASKFYSGTGAGTGVIYVPMNSSSIVQALSITTANDSDERDPASFELYGTNEEVKSTDYSKGDAENWTLIASGDLNLPSARKTKMEDLVINNGAAFSSYKLMFPTLKSTSEGTGAQVAEIQLLGKVLKAAPVNLLTGDDSFLAVRSRLAPTSGYNTDPLESAAMAIDGDPSTKYYNNTASVTNNVGMIVIPGIGKTSLVGMDFTTANDSEGRDPSSYILYGTNEEVKSTDNSTGDAENWIKVAEGTLELPSTRQTNEVWISFDSETPEYAAWKLIFPTNKGLDNQQTIQIADVTLYNNAYENIFVDPETGALHENNVALAVADGAFSSSYPAQEGPWAIADGNIRVKYLNFGKEDSGFIVTPINKTTPTAFMYTTANDSPERDPIGFEIYGTDEEITSLDNSSGLEQNWNLIASGEFPEVGFRLRNSEIVYLSDMVNYTSYKVLFTSLLNGTAANCMQLGEFYFFDLSEPTPVVDPELSYTYENGELVLTFVGGLESSTDGINWVAVDATSPYTVALTGAKMFFRASAASNNGGKIYN